VRHRHAHRRTRNVPAAVANTGSLPKGESVAASEEPASKFLRVSAMPLYSAAMWALKARKSPSNVYNVCQRHGHGVSARKNAGRHENHGTNSYQKLSTIRFAIEKESAEQLRSESLLLYHQLAR
jgi:hypothetical protein